MHRWAQTKTCGFSSFRPLAVAAAAGLLVGAGPAARAQVYFTQSGANSTSPTNYLPFNSPAPQSLHFGTDTIYIANSAPGSFSALAGAQLTAGAVSIANGGVSGPSGSVGDVIFSGVGTNVQLSGSANRLEVGNWGTGTLTVSGGALIDATLNPGNCGVNCYNVVGNAAGSTGTLTVTGGGSEVKTIGGFTLGSGYVGPGFGTTGGTTNAFLNVQAGGTLRTQSTVLAAGPSGTGATEHTFATAVVDGAASRWYVTGTGSGGTSANLTAGLANSQATLTLSNGGQLIIDATAETGPGYNFVNLGGNGGRGDMFVNSGGKLSLLGGTAADRNANFAIGAFGTGSQGFATVTGAGSEIIVSGTGASVNVGGTGTTGTLTVLNAGRVTAGGLYVGNIGGTGTVNVTGGFVDLNGTQGRVIVGNSGIGTLAVSGGGVVDATFNSGACVGNWCGNILANGAGATGTLTIDGLGSEVRTLRSFQAGNLWVDQYTGTPGGTASATINITNGGKLVTGDTTLGTAPSGPNSLGTEQSFVDVLIDGTGSQWTITRNSVDNSAAWMGIAGHGSATATVTVSGGGKLRIDGTGSPGPNDGIGIGSNGKGTLIVTGNGSALETTGLGEFISVGTNNSAGDGSFQLLAGATASSLFLNVGRNGGKGSMLLDGANTQLTLSGVETNPTPGSTGTGTATGSIGRNGGDGTVTVSNGAHWLISDGGHDGRSINGSPQLSIGRDANSKGLLTITGLDSKVEVVSTSMNPVGVGDNNNPFVNIGRENAGGTTQGELLVSAGGKLVLTGNAVSTATDGRATSLNIGGRSGFAAKGTATVTGAGSEIVVQGYDAVITVGREAGGIGTLNVLAGGKVSSTSLAVGISGTGTVNINNATVALSGHRTDSSAVGAGTTIGRGTGGNGTLTMSNGAVLTITPTVINGGMAVGGDQFLSGGTGTVTMSGGSSIVIGGPLSGNGFSAGRTGNGTVTMSQSSFIDVGTGGVIDFGRSPGGVGNLSLSGGAWLHANEIHFGGRTDIDAGGTAVASVGGAGSLLHAEGDVGRVSVGRGGTGTLAVSDQGKVIATFLNIGRASGNGTFSVNQGVIELSGQKNLGGTEFGAQFSIGTGGGAGTASIANNSQVSITNLGSDGAHLNIGGNPSLPLGTGTLSVSGGSQINVIAAAGLGNARIGYDGTGTAVLSGGSALNVGGGNVSIGQQAGSTGILNLSGSSSINVGDGNLYVARETGSTGTLVMSSNSVANAGFVGVGVSQAGTSGTTLGTPGGTGTLVLNNSTVNTSRFELGAGSLLTGDGGVINAGANGPVIIAGTISPGNSPGRLRINCDLTMLSGSKLILEIDQNGVSFDIDQLIIGSESNFDLTQLQIIFSFIGDTDPNAFAASPGGFNLDKFLKAGNGANEQAGLSSLFAADTNWDNYVDSEMFGFESTAYDVTQMRFNANTGTVLIEAAAVPEPASIALALLALAAMAALSRRHAARRV